MDLNDSAHFQLIDREDMLSHLDGLPDQLCSAWSLGLALPVKKFGDLRNVVVSGMGGSAIGADLVAAYLSDQLKIPFVIHRDYGLPGFARDAGTLVIISSHSGNTEECISAFDLACQRGCQVLVITTGGALGTAARERGKELWKFNHAGQPRTAVGYSFGLMLALMYRLGLIEDPTGEVDDAVSVMKVLQSTNNAEVPVLGNPAKRLAGQMLDQHITIFGSGFMAPVARRWKTQMNEVAKAIASFEYLPEADHNTIAGICNPQDQLSHELGIFLNAGADHPRNRERVDKTRQLFMLEGLGTDFFNGRGGSRLAQMWSALLFGDYVSYYLAMLYDTDPTPIPPIEALKRELNP